jgi:ribosome assembly protein YihI (activator of Der GTPase)
MDYPPAVLEKAQRLEQLLKRVTAGESLARANEALGFHLDQRQLARAQAAYSDEVVHEFRACRPPVGAKRR